MPINPFNLRYPLNLCRNITLWKRKRKNKYMENPLKFYSLWNLGHTCWLFGSIFRRTGHYLGRTWPLQTVKSQKIRQLLALNRLRCWWRGNLEWSRWHKWIYLMDSNQINLWSIFLRILICLQHFQKTVSLEFFC